MRTAIRWLTLYAFFLGLAAAAGAGSEWDRTWLLVPAMLTFVGFPHARRCSES